MHKKKRLLSEGKGRAIRDHLKSYRKREEGTSFIKQKKGHSLKLLSRAYYRKRGETILIQESRKRRQYKVREKVAKRPSTHRRQLTGQELKKRGRRGEGGNASIRQLPFVSHRDIRGRREKVLYNASIKVHLTKRRHKKKPPYYKLSVRGNLGSALDYLDQKKGD